MNEQHQQWFTLFDYLEDDLFDGVIGQSDTEQPLVQLSFRLTDTRAREERKTVTSPSSISGGVRTTTTTRTVTSPSKGSASPAKTITTASTSSTTGTTSSSGDKDQYSVRVLNTDLRNGLSQLKDDLNAEQSDIFRYEDGRSGTLGHLENVHRDLENVHINDQVFGAKLNRLDKQICSEIGIATSSHNDDQELLKRQISHTEGVIKEKEPVVSSEQKTNSGLQDTLGQAQGQQRTPAAQELLKDNDGQKKKIQDLLSGVKKERDEKSRIFNQHADLVNKYNDLIGRYEKSLLEVEAKHNELRNETNIANADLNNQNDEGTNLHHYLESTTKSVKNHENQAKALKSDITSLTKHYNGFLDHLNKMVSSQASEVERLNNHLRDQETETNELTRSLTESTTKIITLHSDVDKDNAQNLNAKLSTLISTIVEVDKARRTSQNKLDNAQESWTAKLSLFQDEASRASRESANQKRAVEVENMLAKLNKLNQDRNEIARQRDELEASVITDSNKDVVTDNLQKELEGLTLKLRWAEDEVEKTLKMSLAETLEAKKAIIADQEAQIESLRLEITEIRTLTEERLVTITQLEEDIRQCDIEIAQLRDDIAQLDARIQELQDTIAEKDAEIEELNKTLIQRNNRIKKIEAEMKGSQYVAVKGDQIDEMHAKYIQDCPVPVKRLGGGFYLFGL